MNKAVFPAYPILLIDDDEGVLHSFQMALRSSGINNLMLCSDSRQAMTVLHEQDVHVMLLDLTMPYISGEELLAQVVEVFPELPVMVITGMNDVESAVRCMRLGAFDYMVKPVEKNRLVTSVRRAVEVRDLRRENQALRRRVMQVDQNVPQAFKTIVTRDPSMLAVFRYAESIAESPEPVLITGETGVGKELMANAIHNLSGRQGEFVAVNVAGLDEQVFSDTLFGHTKGAFTGASETRRGMVERAASGTLFLDEIGDLAHASQVKLLRLIQEGEYLPIGVDVPRYTNTRIITSTNKYLSELLDSGDFRNDLYYRLNAHHIHIPPLRERINDIEVLTHTFVEAMANKMNKKAPGPTAELIGLLRAYPFPGNVRELQAMVADAVSSHQSGRLLLACFKKHMAANARAGQALMPGAKTVANPDTLPENAPFPTLKQITTKWVQSAMDRAGGNQSAAARLLGISQPALSKRLQRMRTTKPT
ncbi:MAG: sigma-54-dependent Fis family transcriptional regulator [Spartobacteria bacterium]|nr:sigma-54-dependent Fis family transcriptional regulator [Spartobacteria bacterium]